MGYCPKTNILFLGDEFGNIKFWNISTLLKKVNLHKVKEKKKKIMFKNDKEEP